MWCCSMGTGWSFPSKDLLLTSKRKGEVLDTSSYRPPGFPREMIILSFGSGGGDVGGWGRTWGGSKLKEKRRLRPSYCKRYLARADSGPARHPFEGAVLCAVPSTPLTTRSMPPALPGPIHEALPGPGGCRDLFLCL